LAGGGGKKPPTRRGDAGHEPRRPGHNG
jgi:hypothetical protein